MEGEGKGEGGGVTLGEARERKEKFSRQGEGGEEGGEEMAEKGGRAGDMREWGEKVREASALWFGGTGRGEGVREDKIEGKK